MNRASLRPLFPLLAVPLGGVGGACFTILVGLLMSLVSSRRDPLVDYALWGLLAGGVAGAFVGVHRMMDRWRTTRTQQEAPGEPPASATSAGNGLPSAPLGRNGPAAVP